MRKIKRMIKIGLAKWLESLSDYLFNSAVERKPSPYADLVNLNWFQRLQVIMAEQEVSEDRLAGLTGIPLCRIKDYVRGLRRPSRDHRRNISIVLVFGDDLIWGDGIEKGA